MKAADYKPAHGGFPRVRRSERRAALVRPGHPVVVNLVSPSAPLGFGPGHMQEAYELGLRDGRSGR